MMYWGIDGCKRGWFVIGLDDETGYQFDVCDAIQAFWEQHHSTGEIVLIDMPIGLPSETERDVEAAARAVLKGRASSVFPVPTRQALEVGITHQFERSAYRIASERNQAILGKRLSSQTWAIMPKIHDVDQFLQRHPPAQATFYEAHPEVLFWAFNGKQTLNYPKSQGLGFHERLKILERFQPNALEIITRAYEAHSRALNDDDIFDALACAISARSGKLLSLPAEPQQDAKGLPMRIVYPQM